jgi:hypothetical protein
LYYLLLLYNIAVFLLQAPGDKVRAERAVVLAGDLTVVAANGSGVRQPHGHAKALAVFVFT